MDFFHPLTLGIPTPRRQRTGAGDRSRPSYESWRSSYESWREIEVQEERAEAEIFNQLRAGTSVTPGVLLILGEPGAGKTTLLEEWHARWIARLTAPRLALRIPVLIRLRDVKTEDLVGSLDEMADRLWTRGGQSATGATVKNTPAEAIFDLPLRLFTPVWLLEGLDEAPATLADKGLWDRLAALPGDVVATCRTAVFQSARSEAKGRLAREHCILGLRPGEQPGFLAKALEAEQQDPGQAPALVQQLNNNPALRPLAAIPLLLRLVAQAADRPVLPHNRAGFYDQAINALWYRRLHHDRPTLYELADARDKALAALAAAMGIGTLVATPAVMARAGVIGELREALRQSGLLQFDDRRQCASFPHLTFQEYHLARTLGQMGLRQALEEHWGDARYEETLALLVSRLLEIEAAAGVDEALCWLLKWGTRVHRRNLWETRRSPLRLSTARWDEARQATADFAPNS